MSDKVIIKKYNDSLNSINQFILDHSQGIEVGHLYDDIGDLKQALKDLKSMSEDYMSYKDLRAEYEYGLNLYTKAFEISCRKLFEKEEKERIEKVFELPPDDYRPDILIMAREFKFDTEAIRKAEEKEMKEILAEAKRELENGRQKKN